MSLAHLAAPDPIPPRNDPKSYNPRDTATYQVLIGEPRYFLLDAEFHLGLWGEQQGLAEGLLLLVHLLLQGLHLGLETFHFLLVLQALGLQLCLQQPAPRRAGQVTVWLGWAPTVRGPQTNKTGEQPST